MVQILNTTGLNYHVEQTIANAEERIILISPYLKLSARIKELIEDKNRMKVDIRIIYGKSELNPKDHEWLVSLPYVRLSFCQNLHAKFYANESQSLICSLNLYDFSQINNHELGVLIVKDEDREAFNASITEAGSALKTFHPQHHCKPLTLIRKKIRNRKKMFRNHPQKVTIKLTYLLMIKPLIWMTAQAKTMKLMPSLQIN